MAFWDRLLHKQTKESVKRESPPEQVKQRDSVDNKQIVDRMVEALQSRQTASAGGTFETSGKGIKSIICSDEECPCTDNKQLKLGTDAYLYISPGVVEFRRDCLTVLELEMKISGGLRPQELLAAAQNSMPKYVCEVGARRRALDLTVALADGLAAATTGFVPLRATPRALAAEKSTNPEEATVLKALVSDLLSTDPTTRDQALVGARELANRGIRRGVDALEIAIRRKAGSSVEFHKPGLAIIDGTDLFNARNSVLEIAKRGAICKDAGRVGSLMSSLFLQSSDEVRGMLSDIRQAGGEEQVHQFQLVGTHLQAVAGFQRRGSG